MKGDVVSSECKETFVFGGDVVNDGKVCIRDDDVSGTDVVLW